MNWQDPVDFEAGNHGNKPFSIRIPALVVTRGKNDRLNFLTAMWFTPTGAEPSRMVVAIQKRTLTYDYLLERGEFVMSAPTDKMMDIVVFGGYVSGRDVDKWQAAGLTAVRPSKISVPLIGEAIGNVEYQVVQPDSLRRRHGSVRRRSIGDAYPQGRHGRRTLSRGCQSAALHGHEI